MTEGFEDFLRERREHAERTRRLLVGLLGIVCVALAVSNVILALRLTGLRPPPAGEAPVSPASVASRVEAPPPPVTLPTTTEPPPPGPAEPRNANAPAEEPARPVTPPPTVRDPSSPEIALPPRRLVDAVPARRLPAPRATAPAASPTLASEPTAPSAPAAPEAATAAWMLTTYGRAEAEARAQAALEFYDAESADGRYWRRVLARIVAAR
jgi:type IV secretory pathway VirB10-like protein